MVSSTLALPVYTSEKKPVGIGAGAVPLHLSNRPLTKALVFRLSSAVKGFQDMSREEPLAKQRQAVLNLKLWKNAISTLFPCADWLLVIHPCPEPRQLLESSFLQHPSSGCTRAPFCVPRPGWVCSGLLKGPRIGGVVISPITRKEDPQTVRKEAIALACFPPSPSLSSRGKQLTKGHGTKLPEEPPPTTSSRHTRQGGEGVGWGHVTGTPGVGAHPDSVPPPTPAFRAQFPLPLRALPALEGHGHR